MLATLQRHHLKVATEFHEVRLPQSNKVIFVYSSLPRYVTTVQ